MPSMLGFAELILAIGAAFGFFAVLSLMLFSWIVVVTASSIAFIALILAIIVLSVPMETLMNSRKS